jgi:2-(1,2-epoxy-1,2-dihydrophenyl)acetyl-CoA isomerase
MAYEYLEIERKKNGVCVVTLNHPENLNALGVDISREFKAALADLDRDRQVRVIVIRGAGRAFSSGGNLKDMQESLEGDPGQYLDDLTKEVYPAIDALMKMNKPTIASVHGFAYGAAFNMVLACDLAIAAEGTVFCESFINLGLIPGGHATTLLPRIVGMRRAAEICMTGRKVDANEALILGLVNMVVGKDQLEAHTMKMAEKLAAGPPLALKETKKLLRSFYENSHQEQSKIERATQIEMAGSEDFKEGIKSFFEKRKPKFKGK